MKAQRVAFSVSTKLVMDLVKVVAIVGFLKPEGEEPPRDMEANTGSELLAKHASHASGMESLFFVIQSVVV